MSDTTKADGPERLRAAIPLRLKLVLMAALLAPLPLGVVGVALVDVNAAAVELLSMELQLAIADDAAGTVERELVEAQDGLHGVGRILADPGVEEGSRLALAMSLVEAREAVDHVAVYTAEGRLIDVITEEDHFDLEVPEQLDEEVRRRSIDSGAGTGSVEVRARRVLQLVVVPLRAGGSVTGFVASLVSLEDVQTRLEHIAQGRYEGSGGSVFVVDERRRIIAHPDRARALRLEAAGGEGVLGVSALAGEETAHTTSGEFEDGEGNRMVGATARLTIRPWIVVAQVPTEEAYASLVLMRRIVVGVVLGAILAALLAGWTMARRITAPLSSLTALAQDLAERRFDRSAGVRTRDELSILGHAMEKAAADLEEGEARLREEAAVRSDLGRYLPGALVDKVVRREQDMALGGARRRITVLFADVVAFTPLTERLPAEEVVTILNELFTILTGIVFRHGGTVDKFIGDCVMAIWGAPSEDDEQGARALTAAEDMLRWLEAGNATWQERYGVTVRLAISVHTGDAVVGNIGSSKRMEYTAIGDTVNVAARLEAVARPQQILVTEATRDAAGEDFDYVDLGEHDLAGKEQRVRLFEVRP